MPNILHSPQRPELDRILKKIELRQYLTDEEVTLAKEWLWEIITAKDGEGVSQGDKVTAGDIYSSLVPRIERREATA